jgi:hypothetical protein
MSAVTDLSPGRLRRFEKRIKKTDKCWEWSGGRSSNGYGVFMGGTKWESISAHRYAYLAYVGPIPALAVVMHSCDNKACVNPAHLQVGTAKQNTRDAFARGLNAGRRGSACPTAVLTQQQVDEIRVLYKPFDNKRGGRALGRIFGVTPSTVSQIVRNRTWQP